MRIRRPDAVTHIKGHRLTDVDLPPGIPQDAEAIKDEIDEMWDVLLGRVAPPIDEGLGTLQEVATAYYSRAKEIHGALKYAESEGDIVKNSALYNVRVGPLRDFIDAASKAADLGSRRITRKQVELELRMDYADLDDT